MSIPELHFIETKALLNKIPKEKIAQWLLKEGYYPEQYVVPPSFTVKQFNLNNTPYYEVKTVNGEDKFEPEKTDLISLTFPKTELTDRNFGIIAPKIYHDLVWHLNEEWNQVVEHLFNNDNKFYCYSFPIPVSSKNEGELGSLRAGRMIYEFLEMAENDLVAEAHNYKYVLTTDIKNFYDSVYTHSIAWALHGKSTVRTKGNRSVFSRFLGLRLDKLCQYANDGCTNGIAVGPAISDLIAEIVLAAVDTACSKILTSKDIDYLGVRFKDDYRVLCQSKEDANSIIRVLQKEMRKFNLGLNESKSEIKELPEGLFREWTAEYQPYSLRYKKNVSYKSFENSLRGTLMVDKKYPGTGVVDRFLSELSTKKYKLKLNFNEKNILKALSLFLLLKRRRSKSFPQILGIIEEILHVHSDNPSVIKQIHVIINDTISHKLEDIDENQYDLLWLIYFSKSNGIGIPPLPKKINSQLIKSLKANRMEFFKPGLKGVKIFDTIKKVGDNPRLLEHLALFKK
ncbi:RNA-directed DNA polymerase [Salegentibacter mishustinae]|uniref:RNA-directed DNA polymerase n=1 Tax=Salegentibacter mishustinae TaxID=270918 RepID=UPI0024932E2D|nr:RNA-directed DNA polymerase [Salegentibacter mishustinae]